MLTFLHAADLHLDAPFLALSPEQAVERRAEQRQLLRRLTETARQAEADLILLSGDLFDRQRLRPETMEQLYDCFESLDIPIFIAPGNHDPCLTTSPYRTKPWPSNVHIFTQDSPQRTALPELGVVVYGAAFLNEHRSTSPLAEFRAQDQGAIKLGCFHGEAGTSQGHYAPIPYEDIAASGLDYLALGHNHTASGLKRVGGTFYAWPGCAEGRGFHECGEKGVYLGQLEDGRVSLDFVPLASRRYLSLKLDISGQDPLKALEEYLRQADPRDLARITLTGRREGPIDLKKLTALARGYFYSAKVLDATTLDSDIWSRAGEDSLIGFFLREMQDRLEQAQTAGERKLAEDAVRVALSAFEGREEPL